MVMCAKKLINFSTSQLVKQTMYVMDIFKLVEVLSQLSTYSDAPDDIVFFEMSVV